MGSIIVNNINKRYGKKIVLNKISFNADNEIVFLAGTNGAGKTTFLRIALNLEKADSGKVIFKSDKETKKIEIGSVFDTSTLYTQYSGLKNIKLLCMEYYKNKENVNSILADLSLDEQLLKKKVEKYSFGQKHRLSLAIALIRKPQLMFLDEPTIGLDPISWQLIEKRILKSKEEGCCFIITGQDYNAMKKISDKILVLCNGENLYYGSVAEFMSLNGNSEDLQSTFLNFIGQGQEGLQTEKE